MNVKIDLTFDPKLDAWTIRHVDVHIGSLADVREWERQTRELLDPLPSPFYLLVDLSGFSMAPEMGPEWASLIKHYVLPRTRALIRYGQSTNLTQTSVQLQATVNRFPANIQPDRASAVALLGQIKKQQGEGG